MFSSVLLSLCEIHSVANTSKNVSRYCQAVLLTVSIGHCIMLLGIDPHKNTKNVVKQIILHQKEPQICCEFSLLRGLNVYLVSGLNWI